MQQVAASASSPVLKLIRGSYYRARYYDTVAGRFINEDSTEFAAGPNFYAYTFNSPTDTRDPTGMDAVCSTHYVFTWCSWWWPGSEQPPDAFKQAAYVHEMQHQSDNFIMAVLIGGGSPGAAALANLAHVPPAGCRVYERRGFAAEIKYLQTRIRELEKKKCLTDAEKKELADLNSTLQSAQINADPRLLNMYSCSKQ